MKYKAGVSNTSSAVEIAWHVSHSLAMSLRIQGGAFSPTPPTDVLQKDWPRPFFPFPRKLRYNPASQSGNIAQVKPYKGPDRQGKLVRFEAVS